MKLRAKVNVRFNDRDYVAGDEVATFPPGSKLKAGFRIALQMGYLFVDDSEPEPKQEPEAVQEEIEVESVRTEAHWLASVELNENMIAELEKAGVVDQESAKMFLEKHGSFEPVKFIGRSTSKRIVNFLNSSES